MKRPMVTRELSEAVLAASDLFASRHWKYSILKDRPYPDSLAVPDAETLMHTVMYLIDQAASEEHGRCSTGRFMVEVCDTPCDDGCEEDGGRCAQVFVQLGEVHVR
jgi:hypothetical protein